MADIYGIEIGELPKDWHAISILCIVECVDLSEEGGERTSMLATRSSTGLANFKAIGMLESVSADVKQQYAASTRPVGDEDQDP